MDDEAADKVAQFSAITGANPSTAQTALDSADWNLEEAVGLYFAASDDPHHDHDADFDEDEQAQQPQSSSSAPAPARSVSPPAASSSNPARRPPGQRPKAFTLGDLQRRSANDDSDDDDDRKPDLYTGGEKSGLAVENPDKQGGGSSGPPDHFKNIMQQARANRDRPGGDDDAAEEQQGARNTHFTGRAQTLGGDDAPSTVIADPSAPPAQAGRQRLPRVTRTLHLWADGVSIDEGPLFRFDDPANQAIMTQINQGHAPLSLLNVQAGQEVDLNMIPHKDEKYVQPVAAYTPFGGSGQRLGAPTPGLAPHSSTTAATSSQPQPAAAPSAATSAPAEMEVDESAPIIRLQIRLGDGTRLQSRFNTTHTIGDVYTFVNRASLGSAQRAYVLMTTFPSKELVDKKQPLGDETLGFKRGGVVVQKWK
ncbi:hypothetical protein LTR36_010996 [Oleoguttula mirabilis]|uniref:P97 cofactor p47 n=1 Tax=Oleoguttula mirabilis TaxID=1507867 RepID=A0AAV9J444_9PEZI|nr:hypothetical protein LTR36_010996 [Oleoguttula mirabilis]